MVERTKALIALMKHTTRSPCSGILVILPATFLVAVVVAVRGVGSSRISFTLWNLVRFFWPRGAVSF